MNDELTPEGKVLAKLIASLAKDEPRETIAQEFVQASNLLKRVDPLLKDMYKAAADKDFSLDATNYAVQVAFNAGYRRAMKDVYRILYPEVTP